MIMMMIIVVMITIAGRRPHLCSLSLRFLVCLGWVCHRGRSNQDQVMMVKMVMIVTIVMIVMIQF